MSLAWIPWVQTAKSLFGAYLLAHPHNEMFDRIVKDSNIQSMTELVAKVLNEKTLKTKDTFIHKLNQTSVDIDPINAKLVKTLIKSKDM